MQQTPSWEANRVSASQEIPHILWNPKVHYCSHMSPAPIPVQSNSPGPRLILWLFCNLVRYYGEELFAPRQTPKLEDHPLPTVRECLCNIFAATLHIGGRSSILNLRMRHAVMTNPRPACTEHIESCSLRRLYLLETLHLQSVTFSSFAMHAESFSLYLLCLPTRWNLQPVLYSFCWTREVSSAWTTCVWFLKADSWFVQSLFTPWCV